MNAWLFPHQLRLDKPDTHRRVARHIQLQVTAPPELPLAFTVQRRSSLAAGERFTRGLLQRQNARTDRSSDDHVARPDIWNGQRWQGLASAAQASSATHLPTVLFAMRCS